MTPSLQHLATIQTSNARSLARSTSVRARHPAHARVIHDERINAYTVFAQTNIQARQNPKRQNIVPS